MYRPPTKRRLLVQRIAVYALMTLIVVVLVTVSIFLILGYQFNKSDGRIEQGGLVQFESRPAGASIMIDGIGLGAQTASKTTLTSGNHDIKMERAGYGAWQKTVKVVPGTVLWLNYARLIPSQLALQKVAGLESISSTASSEDHKWLAIKEDPLAPSFRLANTSQDDVKLTDIEIPSTSYTHPAEGKSGAFGLEKWDPDSKFLLIKHTYDDGKLEWLVVNTAAPLETRNVTTLLGVGILKLEFSRRDSNTLYALLSDHSLRRINLAASTLSGPLAANVADFSLFESILSYETLPDEVTKKRSVGYYNEDATKSAIIKSYTADEASSLLVGVGEYFNEEYAAVVHGKTLEILKGDFPRSDTNGSLKVRVSKTLTLPDTSTFLSIKTNGRFVVMQQADTFSVYDFELQKLTTTPIKGTGDLTKELEWLDTYMPWSDRDGTLRVYEFDGANQHSILQVMPGFSVQLSPDGKYIYAISRGDDGSFELKRARLILP